MQYGSGAMSKFEYAATIAVSLAYLLLRQQDAVGCVAFDDHPRTVVPQRTRRNHLNSIIAALDASTPNKKTDFYPVLRNVAESFPRRGLIVLISDLLADRPGLLRGLKMLRSRGHDLLVFHVMDDDELDFPFNGPTRFEGLSRPTTSTAIPGHCRGLPAALGEFLDEVRQGCAHHNTDYALLRTSQPLDAALAAYLSNRLGMHHRN